MVANRQDIVDIFQKNKQELKDYGITKLGIFGSFARDSQTENSDVDLLVEFEKYKKNYRNLIDSADFMEKILGREVDIVTLQSLSPHIGPHIMKEVKYVEIT